MGGFFGAAAKHDIISDVFFGTDYHSHLGTRSGGLAAYAKDVGLQRVIHNIENSPFRTKFEHIFEQMHGTSAIGCINDTDPQPLLIRSNLGTYAICIIGIINNSEQLLKQYLSFSGGHFGAMTGGKVNSTELVAALINQKTNFTDGIRFAQETFAYEKLGYSPIRELGPGEIIEFDGENVKVLGAPHNEMRVCSFLWTYYGYPTSSYEGVNVETMRYRNGAEMAKNDEESGTLPQLDYVGGVPDSGTPHAIGYANYSHVPFARPFIKYTPTWPRSFMPINQTERNRVAKMKQIPVCELIKGKNLLFVDDSIVRGTQLRETVEFLYENGASSVHMRSACPPIMYGCKYLNFSRSTSDMELITRSTIAELEGEEGLKHLDEYSDPQSERGKAMRKAICEKLHFASLEFQTIEGLCQAIGIEPCKLCTYCWTGKE